MHPVLSSSLDPLSEMLVGLTVTEAQSAAMPGTGRWSAQQVIEHLILTYKMTIDTVGRRLKTGRAAKKNRGPMLAILRVQVIGLGRMPRGVPTVHAASPKKFTPMSGDALRERFYEAAEEMDVVLAEARRKFGVEPCGEHWFYGGLRVDEWRRYHAVHAHHHARQLKAAIEYARSPKASVSRD